jgi:hypothetical protein
LVVRRLGALLVVAAVLVVPAVEALSASVGVDIEGNVEAGASLTPRGSIFIDREVGLTGFILGHHPSTGEPIHNTAMGVRGGSGTAEDPFVISNWTIHGGTDSRLWLQNTTSHVEVRDIHVPGDAGTTEAILLDNVTNVTVKEAVVNDGQVGIKVDESHNVSLKSVQVGGLVTDRSQSLTEGIFISQSSDILVENATVSSAGAPLAIGGPPASDIVVRQSTFHRDPGSFSGFSTPVPVAGFENVSLERNAFYGIEIKPDRMATNLSIERNLFEGNPAAHGFIAELETALGEMQDTPSAIQSVGEVDVGEVEICGNDFRNFGSSAVEVGGFSDVTVDGNSFEDVGIAMQSDDANLTVRQNRIESSSDGLLVEFDSRDVQVHENSFSNADGVGASLSSDASLTSNWWGDPSGPNVTGVEDSGTGAQIDPSNGVNFTYDPYLTSAPATGPDAVDCGLPQDPRGAQAGPNLTVAASIQAELGLQVNEEIGPAHIQVNARMVGSSQVGPVPYPSQTPPPFSRAEG